MREPNWRAERTVDLLVVGAFGMLAVAQTWVEARAGTPTLRVVLVATANLMAAVLLLRRRRNPVTVVLGTAGCAAVGTWAAAHPAVGPLAPAVALYTLAQAGWRRAAGAGGASLVLLAVADAVRGGRVAPEVAQTAAVLAVAGLVGLYAGGRAQVAAADAARAEQLEREQALRAREAVQAERMWIARELHDSIGHHVSLLVVQAGAVSATVPDDHPARPVLDSMIAGGKEAMTEMRRMVDLLRPVAVGVLAGIGTDSEAGALDNPAGASGTGLPGEPLGPPPGVAEIPALCQRLRRTGLPVEARLSGGADAPRTASVAAYRIVQEALTNVVKHAGPVPTFVRVDYTGDILDLRITNAAGRPAEPSNQAMTGGSGQLGMRARVDLFGGRLIAGPVPGGGYAVHATLRLDSRA